MIAKLCTWAPTRAEAIKHMGQALDRFEIQGAGDNLNFLSAIVEHPRFISGDISTAFIAEEYPDGFSGVALTDTSTRAFVAATAALQYITSVHRQQQIKLTSDSSTSVLAGERSVDHKAFVVRLNRSNHPVSWVVQDSSDDVCELWGNTSVDQNDEQAPVSIVTDWLPGESLCHTVIDDVTCVFQVTPMAEGFQLVHKGAIQSARLLSAHKAALADRMIEKAPPDTSNLLLCPMPGLLVAVNVAEGDEVEEGQALAVVEAMKMENVLASPRTGVVSKVLTKAGQSLSVDDVILEFKV